MKQNDDNDITEDNGNESVEQTIKIGGKTFTVGKDYQKNVEIAELVKIAERESGQMQFVKQGICAFLILCVIALNLMQPTASRESPVGISICSWEYWFMVIGFVLVCVAMTALAIKISSTE